MKVIVTGSGGNLGSHLIKNKGIEFLGINRSNWNVLNDIKIGEYDAVIHTAYDLKNSIVQMPVENLDSNIQSTARLLKICADKGIKKFGFVSSCAVYGDSSNSSEEKTCQPVTMNGHIKLFNEELVKHFCASNKINYQIYRVFNTYGGNDEFSVVQRMIKAAKNKTVFNLVNEGVSERDFIHVNDVASIICNLLQKDLNNEVINIGSGESVRIVDVLKSVENKFGSIELLQKTNPDEAIFSRANIKKMKSLMDYKTVKILDYINGLTP
jgi:nucleoside-diphosphate-sugar epimerase